MPEATVAAELAVLIRSGRTRPVISATGRIWPRTFSHIITISCFEWDYSFAVTTVAMVLSLFDDEFF